MGFVNQEFADFHPPAQKPHPTQSVVESLSGVRPSPPLRDPCPRAGGIRPGEVGGSLRLLLASGGLESNVMVIGNLVF